MSKEQQQFANDLRETVKNETLKAIENNVNIKKMRLDVEKIKESAISFINEKMSDSYLLDNNASIKYAYSKADFIVNIAIHTTYKQAKSEEAIASFCKKLGV